MCTIHNDPGTGSPKPRTPASGVPAVLTSVVASLLLFFVAPHGHAQTNSVPVLGTVPDQTFLDDQEVDTDLTNSVADPVVLPAATGGDGALTYTLECADTQTGCDTTSKLPPGLVFTASSRKLSGTPTTVGHFDMNYKVEDADGDSDSTAFQITVLLVPWLSIDAPSVAEGGDGDTPELTFTVTLSLASSDTITVDYADAGTGTATSGTDYDAVTAGTLTFAPGEVSETINVTVNGDTAIESDETVVIKLSNKTNTVGAGTGTGTIENDDFPVLSIDEPSVVEGGDGDTPTLTFTVTLNPASSDTVTVKFADAGTGTATSGTDYDAVTAGTLTFAPNETEKTVDVTVNGDTDDEPNETVVIKLSEPSNAQFAGGMATVEGTGTIENDDDPVITIDAPVVIGRGDGGDGLTGAGIELAGGVRYRAPGLEVEARGRWLAAHVEAGARERGVSVTARVGPGAHGRGLSLLLAPRWGAETGRADALWSEELPRLAGDTGDDAASLDARMGYGLALAPQGLLTPFAETALTGGERRRLRLGTRFDATGADLGVELAGERRESAAAEPEHALTLDVIFRF